MPGPLTLPRDPAALRGQSAKRVSILDAAAEVFCREGFAGANIDQIAAEAGVSRQTIYNHHGDKHALFMTVIRELTERSSAGLFATLASFPDDPVDLEAELTAFAGRLLRSGTCNRDCSVLRRLIDAEGERYPELFVTWRQHGPGRTWAAMAARFALLDHAGHLSVEDPQLAARQFMALLHADLHPALLQGPRPTEAEIDAAAAAAVRTFLRAFRPVRTAELAPV